MIRCLLSLLVAGAFTFDASAQQQPQTQGDITWNLEYHIASPGPSGWADGTVATEPGGIIGPGQGALFRLRFSLSLTPGGVSEQGQPLGSPLTWDSAIFGSGSGGLGGLWGGFVDIVGSGADPVGNWSDNSVAWAESLRRRTLPPYAVAGAQGVGQPFPDRINNIQPAQFGAVAGLLDHGNHLIIWQGLWIPDRYDARSVDFAPQLGSLGWSSMVYAIDNLYEFGFEFPIALRVETLFGPAVTIHIIPAPATLALLIFAAGMMRRPERSLA